ncbi:MAG TPA: TIGR02147 family protein [Minicystis sp.]|nr:TIGR02147 family protein [Minicystis sp.]
MVDEAPPKLPNVYEYLDYRAFLRDHFDASKKLNRAYSFRYFSRKAGLASSNFLKLVMQGKRNLGASTVERFAKALKLAAAEGAFFADLVALNQAESLAEKNRAFERVAANRRFRAARRLDGPLFEYLTHWYYPAIRELAGRADFDEDPRWIASQILPSVTPEQARQALVTLEQLGLLTRDEGGKLVRGDTSLTTGHEVRAVVVPAYHRQMIERAGSAVDTVPPEERDVSALTVCIRAATLGDLKERIHRFREEMMHRCDTDDRPERVYQLCIQLFPLSKPASAPLKAAAKRAAR